MSFEAERATIEGLFQTQWSASAYASTTVIYDNISTKRPSTDYVYHQIISGDGMQKEIVGTGAALHRYFGIVQVDILVPIGTGTATARGMADVVSTIYRRRQLTDGAGGRITFRTPSIRVVGVIGERYRVIVSCPFQRDIRH